jgi:hypothetical protein
VATLDRFLSVKTAFLALTELLEPEPTGGAHGKPNDAPTGGMELRFLELGVEIRRIAAELEVATVERFARLGGDLKALLALIDAPFVADRATSAVPRSRMTLLSVSPECLCVRPVMGGTFATYEPGSVPLQVGLSAPRKKAGPQLPYVAVVPVAYDDGYGGGQVHRQLPEGFDHARWAQEVLSVRDEVLVDTFTDDGVRRETWEQAVCIPLHLTSEPSAGSNASSPAAIMIIPTMAASFVASQRTRARGCISLSLPSAYNGAQSASRRTTWTRSTHCRWRRRCCVTVGGALSPASPSRRCRPSSTSGCARCFLIMRRSCGRFTSCELSQCRSVGSRVLLAAEFALQ